ncbi:murein DD-endopeptidase MepM/ murein hydrolase activator NlpD [Novosphingobium chloroacetimidivorans]|uniref:Murein DD-endopeptidase MepM/ murein hydrolase activator NlpD n=1 Tax=Novosphingobium chloroacetimidivorans TaxID=1428314 RepID=A0A7W7K8M5_9SPHN|nr:M23 family metallopeptidase [Novosphingobium chloroacetimidivorans]MBB4858000.1 murein DD-endopeptidase MepM/ murein hydrolase activator NlpD [Novosphingobium chloroacetimidivorans]
MSDRSRALGSVASGVAILLAGCTASPPSDVPAPAGPAEPPSAVTFVPARPSTFAFAGELTQGGWIKGTVPAGTRTLALGGQPIAFAPDGSFFAAFDRDAPATSTLVATLRSGEQVARTLSIAPRAWRIERVNIARRENGPTEAFLALRRPELARIEAARTRVTDAAGWRQDFIFPVKARISGRFGSQRVYRGEPGAYHSGLDLAGGAGTTFVAPADGVVILAAQSPFTLEGNLLMIDHGMGLNSAFLHCSQILVREGEHVRQGQPIGRIGATGRATGPHLHWSMKWNDARIDPILLTGPMQ